jgi:hypothetical protein
LGVVYHDGLLYVADTYNSKIKQIYPDSRTSETFAGGEAGWQDGAAARFDEPGGLSLGDGRLYVADTNNHVIRVVELATRETTTLVLVDVDGLLTRQPAGAAYSGKVVTLEEIQVAPGEGRVEIDVRLPEGYKLNELAPFSMEWRNEDGRVAFDAGQANQSVVAPELPLSFPATFAEGETTLSGELVIYYCQEEAQALCLIERVRLVAPLVVEAGGETTVALEHTIPPPPVDNGS